MNGLKVERKRELLGLCGLTSSSELQIWSFHVIVSLGMSKKYVKMKKRTRGTCSNVCFLSMCKFVTFSLS